MLSRLMVLLLIVVLFFGVDYYVYHALRTLPESFRRPAQWISLFFSIGSIVSLLLFFLIPGLQGSVMRNFLMTMVFTNLLIKLVAGIFVLLDDIIRLGKWVVSKFTSSDATAQAPTTSPQDAAPVIPRSEFLIKAAAIAGTVPLIGVGYGILLGAHDYRVRRVTLRLPNLPRSFDGLRIAQISDIHSGSFFNKRAVTGGVDMLLKEKPDMIFFTGDLVNNIAEEVAEYVPIFQKLKAPLGVFSTLGNHDYGDYVNWESAAAKTKNLQDLMHAHKLMGWDLLMDENRKIVQSGDELSIIGIQNWGRSFSKHGNLAKAYKGAEDAPVKLLLSHDPTHWDAQVRPNFQDIDVAFAGHTHGAQFGVEIGNFHWSPVKYAYKQWAGLYQEKNDVGKTQYLYVNRGYGYIGFPGRVGMPPEITIFELKVV
ncbi:metallophosphoesterase [Cytophagaceae bacterium YF14B1]|uniref:Metallophosphoesterase n=1 Tax=Xanthocytophaga flava TaxID=3048013 RepID=A0AAE3QL88_9BACT|nr:metallophosphoesterase [Xanthocytophaga flavus]MDJ1481407.1 metallophosphoesterase [Xanthocytophaga flavus]